jgi:tetratricopeptide (TPR) repeat protein
MDEYKYRAFISYSHRNSGWASWLHRALEGYRPPRPLIGTATAHGPVPKRLHPVFRDRDELASDTDLGTAILAALAGSACQIVICSRTAAKSRWVDEEILAFKRLGREDRIFCLIVDGEPNATDLPGRADEECFPRALRYRLGPDGALSDVRTEPIAADCRPGKDGKNNAKLKLIAGLLGVGFDALKRREQQRRARRLAVITGAATCGMVLMSGLAVYALVQRTAAQKQTVRAEAEAATAQATTKFLVDLFKISDPGEARGNTVTAREMLDKGALRVDKELAQQPAIQATLMDTLGTVYMGLGLYDQAKPLLERAVSTRRSRSLDDPLALSQALSHLGDLLMLRAELDAAEKAYLEALKVEALRPNALAVQVQLANTQYGFGVLLAQQGRYPEAERNLREALARQQALYGTAHPDIARTLKDLAQTVADGGDGQAALPLMEMAVAMQRKLRGTEPHPDLASAINDLALLLESRGQYDAAETLYAESLAMKRRLFGEQHPEVANALENLATDLSDEGDLARAEPLYRRSLTMWRALLGEDHPEVATALHNLAALEYDRGNTHDALALQRESLAIFRKVYPKDHPMVAMILNQVGFWLTLAGEYAEAERDIRDALAMRIRLLGEHHPDIASSQLILATLRVRQHRYSEALDPAQRAVDSYTRAMSPNHWRTAAAVSVEGAALTGLGRYREAEPLLAHANEVLSQDHGAPLEFLTMNQRYLEALHRRERAQGQPIGAGGAVR